MPSSRSVDLKKWKNELGFGLRVVRNRGGLNPFSQTVTTRSVDGKGRTEPSGICTSIANMKISSSALQASRWVSSRESHQIDQGS